MQWLSVTVCFVIGLLCAIDCQAGSPDGLPSHPKIALIIDDMGNYKRAGETALALPGRVTYAFLPHTPFSRQQADKARRMGKEVMLHLPMESLQGKRLGSGGLTIDMSKQRFLHTLAKALESVPHVSGVNNHMGSLLTRDPTAMRWLMSSLRERKLFFIDSRTTDQTVAAKVARKNLVAHASRKVFLDNVEEKGAIRRQLRKLLGFARQEGHAIGIGHPYDATLAVLAESLPELRSLGVELVPASQLTQQGRLPWHVSSSPSPRGVKNLKLSPSQIY
jgi:polysaccharide deacetylase 2 family uncharacterized protein YibQ